MLLSVLVPVYNVEPYLERCLTSILANDFANFELILIDDGSTDGSAAICDEYARSDTRVRVLHKGNGGVSSARNAGLALASGEWIMWVDSDDYLAADWLEKLLPCLNEEQDVVFFGYIRVTDGNEEHISFAPASHFISKRQFMRKLCNDERIKSYLCTKVMRKALYAEVCFPAGVDLMEDYSVLPQIIDKAANIYYLAELLYYYRIHQASICRSADLPARYQSIAIAKERYAWYRAHGYDVSRYCYFFFVLSFCAHCCRLGSDAAKEYYHRAREVLAEESYMSIFACECKAYTKLKLVLVKLGIFAPALTFYDVIKEFGCYASNLAHRWGGGREQ